MRIVYRRDLKKEDFQDFSDQIIFFKDDNIAYIIVKYDGNYILRKKKIFNGKEVENYTVKTISQVLKKVGQ